MRALTVESNGIIRRGIEYSIWEHRLKGLLYLVRVSTDNPPRWTWFNRIGEADVVKAKKGNSEWYEICKPKEEEKGRLLVKTVFAAKISGIGGLKGEEIRQNIQKNIELVHLQGNATLIETNGTTRNYSTHESHSGKTLDCGTMFYRESLIIIDPNSVIVVDYSESRNRVLINKEGKLESKSLYEYREEETQVERTYI